MRALPARRIATSALCATLLLGVAAPAALAADRDSAAGRTQASTPLPNAQALLGQVESLSGLGDVLGPVGVLVEAVLKADNGQLTPVQADELGDDAREAITRALAATVAKPATVPQTSATSNTPTTPATPTAPSAPASPVAPAKPAEPTATASTLPAVPGLGRGVSHDDARAGDKAPADLQASLAELRKAVELLLVAATSGIASEVMPAVQEVLDRIVAVVNSAMAGAGRPAEAPAATTPTDVSVALPSAPVTLPAEQTTARPSEPVNARPSEPVNARPSEPVTARPSEPAAAMPEATMPAATVPVSSR
jgi:hypothetical protein